MLSGWRKKLFYSSIVLLAIGTALLILPPYNNYCGTDNANNKYYSAYEVVLSISVFLEAHNGAITAIATAFIAWFTLTLWQSSEKMWLVTNRSAELAERTLTELESPSVFVKVIETGLKVTNQQAYFERGRLKYHFVNYGRSPAFITAYGQQIRVMKPRTGSPRALNVADDLRTVPWGFVVPPEGGESELVTMNCISEIPLPDHALLECNRNIPFLLVAFKYRDTLDNSFTAAFCFMLDTIHDRYVLTSNGYPHNFLQKEPRT
jgi:hypothetical protein